VKASPVLWRKEEKHWSVVSDSQWLVVSEEHTSPAAGVSSRIPVGGSAKQASGADFHS
jgi:hypothetical protein